MKKSRLSKIQLKILETLATIEPRFTLVGGGALSGVHLGHRETRDLDLFFRNRSELGEITDRVLERLSSVFRDVDILQRDPSFVRVRVSDDTETVLTDLAAYPVPAVEPDQEVRIGAATLLVATLNDILVSKLCSLLSRAELRDLLDIQALLDEGVDLKRATAAAPKVDGGFSLLTLAWVLRDFNVKLLAVNSGFTDEEADRLDVFLKKLIGKLLELAYPGSDA